MASDVHSERETIDPAPVEAELFGQADAAVTAPGADDEAGAEAAVPSPTADGDRHVDGGGGGDGDGDVDDAEPTVTAGDPAPAGPRRLTVLLLVAALALLVDVVSKMLVVSRLADRDPVHLVDGALRLTLIRNSGAAFSIGEGQTWVFTIIATAVVVVILRISRNLRSVPWACALGLLLGGALGNLGDRIFRSPGLFRGHVVDFIQFGQFPIVHYDFPVFNLADSAIVVGGCLMVLLSFLGRQPDGSRHRGADEQEPAS